jgi:wyosine [tRNA(Phe)-imidazoG37] synthetase (radical SAM superfamily)
MIAFGPVPSRRLGRSLGINNIPPKVCSYACTYCQLGSTLKMQVRRTGFYSPDRVLQDVQDRMAHARATGEAVDCLSFVPDGEPTLEINLGRQIGALRALGIKIAVITNSSLLWRADVRADLMAADWVSVKVDTVREQVWRQIDRPQGTLQLQAILDGVLAFSKVFPGQLATETMLVGGLNDSPDQIEELARFLSLLAPATAYLATPTRPPAEKWVHPPGEDVLNRSYQVLSESVPDVEYLIGYEGNAFASTGNAEEDLLSITAVHPMREDAVEELLARSSADWSVVQELTSKRLLVETEYEGHRYFARRLRHH